MQALTSPPLLAKRHKLDIECRDDEWGAGVANRLSAALARVGGEIPQEENDNWFQQGAAIGR